MSSQHTSFRIRNRHPAGKVAVYLMLAAIALLQLAPVAQAVSYVWSGTTDANWSTDTNWSPAGGPPGSLDSATFNVAVPASGAVISTGSINLTSLTFDTANAGAYTIGSVGTDTITLADTSAAITMTATTGNSEQINAN